LVQTELLGSRFSRGSSLGRISAVNAKCLGAIPNRNFNLASRYAHVGQATIVKLLKLKPTSLTTCQGPAGSQSRRILL
jgi:hypothetical protein